MSSTKTFVLINFLRLKEYTLFQANHFIRASLAYNTLNWVQDKTVVHSSYQGGWLGRHDGQQTSFVYVIVYKNGMFHIFRIDVAERVIDVIFAKHVHLHPVLSCLGGAGLIHEFTNDILDFHELTNERKIFTII